MRHVTLYWRRNDVTSKARIKRDFAKTLTPSSEFFDMKLWSTEKTTALISKLTNFVIWNNVNSFYYAGTKNLLIWDQDTNFKLGAITQNAVIFASFLTGVVLNTLFSASGFRIAIKNL